MNAPSLAARLLLALVGAYKVLLAPLVGGACRYSPSCSEYMSEAVARHGALRGGWLGVRRLSRCHPWGGHGFDPVPPGEDRREPWSSQFSPVRPLSAEGATASADGARLTNGSGIAVPVPDAKAR